MSASILIVDDESGIRESLGALLRDEGYEVETAGSGEECLERLDQRDFDLVLLDVWLPKMDGLETLERIQRAAERADGGDDFRARKHRDGRARDETGRVRFHREAAFDSRKWSWRRATRWNTSRSRWKTGGCARN